MGPLLDHSPFLLPARNFCRHGQTSVPTLRRPYGVTEPTFHAAYSLRQNPRTSC